MIHKLDRRLAALEAAHARPDGSPAYVVEDPLGTLRTPEGEVYDGERPVKAYTWLAPPGCGTKRMRRSDPRATRRARRGGARPGPKPAGGDPQPRRRDNLVRPRPRLSGGVVFLRLIDSR